MTPVLELVDVTYTFPDATSPALHGFDLSVEPGELVVVAGASGSGKSTLLRAAAGLVPHFHGGRFGGTLRTGGLDVREHGPAEFAAIAGSLFQDPESQIVMTTVRSEIAFPLENRGWDAAGVARGVEEVALGLGIAGLLDRSTHELSGGEQQRVALAAALAGRPRLVLLDEPTSMLDPVAGDELFGLLRRLNEEWGTAILLAEHRLERCLPAADRVIALDGGRLAFDGTPAAFQRWAVREAPWLATPPARLFAAAGIEPVPVGIKDARATLRRQGLLDDEDEAAAPPPAPAPRRRRRLGRRAPVGDVALRLDGVWHELRGGAALLRGLDLTVAPGERIALMGRNGAGKTTLLRHAAGLLEPTRGKVVRAGRVAMLPQRADDLFLRDHLRDEVSAQALERFDLAAFADRDPKSLSGGERQRAALAIALDAPEPPVAVGLDEPTRGMDRRHRDLLVAEIDRLAHDEGTAVIVATHDPEFAAAAADRVVLLGDGVVIADAPAADVLSGGWYFATQTARVLGGAGRAVLPEDGAHHLMTKRQNLGIPV